MHKLMYACMGGLMHVCMHAWVNDGECTFLVAYTYIYIYTYMYAYRYIQIHTYTCIHTYIHACMRACIHICCIDLRCKYVLCVYLTL